MRRVNVGEWIIRRESVRHMRMQRHLVVSVLAVMILIVAFSIPDPLLRLVLMSTLVLLTLESLARGMSAVWGYLWGWPYPEPTQATRVDVFIDGVVRHLAPPRPAAEPDPKITLLDPWDGDVD
jgi:hypothetical protein